MDAICGTGFGVEVDSQRNPDNPFIKYAKQFLEVDMAGNPVLLFSRKKPSLSDAFAYIIFFLGTFCIITWLNPLEI